MKTFLSVILSAFCALLSAQSTYFPEEMVVTATTLNLRETPDVNGKKVTGLPQGTVVKFIQVWENGMWVSADSTDENAPWGPWLKVSYKDKTGWAFGTYLTGTTTLMYEDEYVFGEAYTSIPPMMFYGIYQRDSFADEIRRVQVRYVKESNDMFGENIFTLKTNQPTKSKFIIASTTPLQEGYCGALGIFDLQSSYYGDMLTPGSMQSIYPGNDMNDTIIKPSYGLAATGCARLENGTVLVNDYKLTLIDYMQESLPTQNLTQWFATAAPEISPNVRLLWYGDLDHDNKPDAIFQDCPYEIGCRASLFLSSKAKSGEYLRKVAEHFWPGE
ncbi:MAG: SH3 domain-containing protein [Saprospiraceae bacterium]|nr:SH3 domain-containing protein [Saprospiraceae bacterium]